MWYRLYELDDGDHILKATSLEYPNDAEALAGAQAHAVVRDVELWQGARRLGRFERQSARAEAAPWPPLSVRTP